tara:strand:- start:2512 stop:2799 length:288 start_codon:yes stop_codon:yes gene_type:complete
MSWWSNVKKWFWGDLKPELQDEPVEKAQPKEITTTDEVLEEAVKKTLEKEPEVKKRKPRKKPAEKKEPVKKAPAKKKPAEKKPRKPRKKKESNAD